MYQRKPSNYVCHCEAEGTEAISGLAMRELLRSLRPRNDIRAVRLAETGLVFYKTSPLRYNSDVETEPTTICNGGIIILWPPDCHSQSAPPGTALQAHYENIKTLHLRELFAQDPTRGERLTCEADDLFLDYSKNLITDETIQLLLKLAAECGLRERIDAMFAGEKINTTEDRAVLHVALRASRDAHIYVDGEDVVPDVLRDPR